MKQKSFFLALAMFCNVLVGQENLPDTFLPVLDVPFADSMKMNDYPKLNKGSVEGLVFEFFKKEYENIRSACISVQDECKIPKLFHYIWLGTKLPDQYKPYLQSWLDHHPDWMFLIWVDNEQNYDLGMVLEDADFGFIQEFLADENYRGGVFVVDVKNLVYDNKIFFDGTRNYGERSDILRWELLFRFGGTYIDVDFECFKPFDVLHHMYDFYTGLQPMDTCSVQFGSGLVGAVPGHPILRCCVETISADQSLPIVTRTGPVHFMYSFFEEFSKNSDLINAVLPAGYFYPRGFKQPEKPKELWIRPESFATHHWAGSWLKQEGWINF